MRTTRSMYLLYALIFAVTCALGCCAQHLRYRVVDEAYRRPHIRPEVSIQMESLDRMEVYAGGIHVGTFFFDGSGAVFVGDPEPSAKIIQEMLTQLEMLRAYFNRDTGERYY